MKPYCYCDGRIQLLRQARLAPNDLGALRGYGVFDFLRTFNGKPFLLDEHLARFRRSAATLGLKVPKSDWQIVDLIKRLFKKNRLADGSIRLVVTGGPSDDGFTWRQPNFYILVEDLYELPRAAFERGIKLITAEHERQFPEAKTTNYLTAIKLQPEKKRAGATEILYTYRGQALEASTSNFFIVKRKRLITPRDGVLPGITRKLVFQLARPEFKVSERPIRVAELKSADEAFITATNKNICPVVKIDRQPIGAGRVGPVTRELMRRFQKFIDRY